MKKSGIVVMLAREIIGFQSKKFSMLRHAAMRIPRHPVTTFDLPALNNFRTNLELSSPNFLESEQFQYCSDLHVDCRNNELSIVPVCNNLLIAGDVGLPTNDNFIKFFRMVSSRFDKVYFTPGNHEYDCFALFNVTKYNEYKPLLKNVIGLFDNVFLLDNNVAYHNKDIVIIGTTLWSEPHTCLEPKYIEHNNMHKKCVDFINTSKLLYRDKKIIVLSHYVPTHKLIEEKFKNHRSSSLFVTNLEKLMTDPICAWVCGHTHSVMEDNVGNVKCVINAHGYSHENKTHTIKTKTFYVKKY